MATKPHTFAKQTLSRVRRQIDRFARRRPRPAIIMYHRVAAVAHDPWGLCVSPANFEAQLECLRTHRIVLPMSEFADLAASGRLPDAAVAITFDDGYVDNLDAAAPLLAERGLPATLFLATGPTLRGASYWFEDLAELILDDPTGADFAVQVGSTPMAVRYGARAPLDENRLGWRAWDAPRTEREAAFYTLWDCVRPLTPDEQQRVLNAVAATLRRSPARDARPMNASEVRAVAQTFEIGGHTVDHVDLLALDDAAATDQMLRGRLEVEMLTGRPIDGFAYPFGRHEARLAPLVRDAGFAFACTTEHAHVAPRGARPYFLPRISADDVADIEWLG